MIAAYIRGFGETIIALVVRLCTCPKCGEFMVANHRMCHCRECGMAYCPGPARCMFRNTALEPWRRYVESLEHEAR